MKIINISSGLIVSGVRANYSKLVHKESIKKSLTAITIVIFEKAKLADFTQELMRGDDGCISFKISRVQ